MRIGSLFSGYGGLDSGVQAAIGGRVVFHVEHDTSPSAILAHRYPGIPNYGDITALDWSRVPAVDVLVGGFPCQDVSLAGARRGLSPGTRSGLWAQFAAGIYELRPRLVIIENVRGLLSANADRDLESCPWCLGDDPNRATLRALGAVLGDLAGIGYDARWLGLRAADAGAPHARFRIFIAAYPRGDEPERWGRRADMAGTPGTRESDGRERERVRNPAIDRGPAAPDAARIGWRKGGTESAGIQRGFDDQFSRAAAPDAADDGHERHRRARDGRPGSADGRDAAPPDTDGGRRGEGEPVAVIGGQGRIGASLADERGARPGRIEWGEYGPAIRRWEAVTGRPAPAPTLPDGRNGAHRLSAAFVEWMMGIPSGHVTAVPGLSRSAQLKALGNGVVPQQAELAVGLLLNRGAGSLVHGWGESTANRVG